MSRVGKRLLTIPEGVEVNIDDNNQVSIKGPLGELSKNFPTTFAIKVEDGKVQVEKLVENKTTKMMYGTINSLIEGMIVGVKEGFKKELEINGVGYNVKMQGANLLFSLGYSHKIEKVIPQGLKAEIGKPTELTISGIDKQLVGQFAAQIKKLRPPEPYGGKGIRYKGEHIIRKAGKAAKK